MLPLLTPNLSLYSRHFLQSHSHVHFQTKVTPYITPRVEFEWFSCKILQDFLAKYCKKTFSFVLQESCKITTLCFVFPAKYCKKTFSFVMQESCKITTFYFVLSSWNMLSVFAESIFSFRLYPWTGTEMPDSWS